MSTGQIIFLGLGIIVILSSFDFSSFLRKIEDKANKIDIPNVIPSPSPTVPIKAKDNLVEVVQKWQCLKDACEQNKLTEAITKLDEIFPMLIKVDKK
jgi:hypothetical protein